MEPYDWNVDEGGWSAEDAPWSEEEQYWVARRAWMLYREGVYRDAAVLFRGLTAAAPENGYGWKGLALTHVATGNHEAAWECWEKLTRMSGSGEDAIAGRCETAIVLGRWEDAASGLERLREAGTLRAAGQAEGLRIRLEAATQEKGPR